MIIVKKFIVLLFVSFFLVSNMSAFPYIEEEFLGELNYSESEMYQNYTSLDMSMFDCSWNKPPEICKNLEIILSQSQGYNSNDGKIYLALYDLNGNLLALISENGIKGSIFGENQSEEEKYISEYIIKTYANLHR